MEADTGTSLRVAPGRSRRHPKRGPTGTHRAILAAVQERGGRWGGDSRTGRPGPDGRAAMVAGTGSGTAPSLRQVLAFEGIGVLGGDSQLGCGTRLVAVPAPVLGGMLKKERVGFAEIRARPVLDAGDGDSASRGRMLSFGAGLREGEDWGDLSCLLGHVYDREGAFARGLSQGAFAASRGAEMLSSGAAQGARMNRGDAR